MKTLTLTVLRETFAICRLEPDAALPEVLNQAAFFSATRSAHELSLVLPETLVDPAWQVEAGWSAFVVNGPLDFSLTGILAGLTVPLATADISIFAVSTFDTDYLLVKTEKRAAATAILGKAGFRVISSGV